LSADEGGDTSRSEEVSTPFIAKEIVMNERSFSKRVAILPIFSGLVAGAVGSFGFCQFAARAQGDRKFEATQPAVEASAAVPVARDNSDLARSDLDFRLGRLEARAVAQAAASNAVQEAAMPDMSEAAAAKARLEAQKPFEDFGAQSVDARWASATATPLEEDLTKLAEAQHFKIASVECRGDACMVEAQWPTYVQASKNAALLAHEPLRVNCPRRIELLPEQANAPGEVRVLLECSTWKTQGSPLLADLPPARY
jgi:hypothetical protein